MTNLLWGVTQLLESHAELLMLAGKDHAADAISMQASRLTGLRRLASKAHRSPTKPASGKACSSQKNTESYEPAFLVIGALFYDTIANAELSLCQHL
jgi:hypothetical protein